MTKRAPRVPGEPPAQVEQPEPVADDLPNAIDIDATKITSPVLTRQGWVVPADKPLPRPNFV